MFYAKALIPVHNVLIRQILYCHQDSVYRNVHYTRTAPPPAIHHAALVSVYYKPNASRAHQVLNFYKIMTVYRIVRPTITLLMEIHATSVLIHATNATINNHASHV